jgi:putative endopeptidase
MKRLLLSAAAALALSAAAGAFALANAADAAPAAATSPVKDPTAAARMGPWGFDIAGMDRKVAPGENFVRYATGTYLDNMVIPADRVSWGSFNALAELSNSRTQAIIDRASATQNATGEAQQIGGLYNSFMDVAGLDALGAKPLAADFARIRAASTREAQAGLMGRSQGAFGASFFGSYIWQDAKAPTRYAAYVSQGGLGLPDRDYYLDAKFADKKTAYRAHVAKVLTLAGWPGAEKAADAIVALETRIAEVSWTKVEQRDADKTYNPRTLAELEAMAPGFPWKAWARGAGLDGAGSLIVGEPTAFTKIAAIYGQTPVPVIQAWQAFHTADQASPYLSKAFSDANFDFYGKTLSGQPEQRSRAKRGASLVGGNLGEAVGKLYVAAYFPASSKASMEGLVNDLLVAMKGRIDKLDWMSPATKARAQKKLSTFTVKIGYPDKWRDYSTLTIKADDLYGNMERINAFNWAYETGKLGKPVDRDEWGMFPQTVNAYYNPTLNEIVFPAAILQPPFFDPLADPAINYGGIGAVIGHEISHGFDDQGRKYDADGSLNDWWQADDSAQFDARKGRLGAMYGAFEPLEGFKLNGDLTMGENIGDLGGLLIALDAYHLSLGGKPAPIIDGFTGDQRFFLGFAQIWRAKARDEAMKQQVTTGPHSPPYFRAYGTVRNIDAWYDAFDVKEGDAMYVKPSDRARIW